MNTRVQQIYTIARRSWHTNYNLAGLTVEALVAMTLVAGVAQADAVFHQDAQRTGRSSFVGPSVPMVKWKFQTNGVVTSSPAIGIDGTIYAGSFDNKFYAINP
ncbi:MAG: PQQ-binding-like beta-propeller repeat protein, partial [Armatimonadota bacterium]